MFGRKKGGIFCRPLVASKQCPIRTSLITRLSSHSGRTQTPLLKPLRHQRQASKASLIDTAQLAVDAVTSRTPHNCRAQVWLVNRLADHPASQAGASVPTSLEL